jgi:hypothetical protein
MLVGSRFLLVILCNSRSFKIKFTIRAFKSKYRNTILMQANQFLNIYLTTSISTDLVYPHKILRS